MTTSFVSRRAGLAAAAVLLLAVAAGPHIGAQEQGGGGPLMVSFSFAGGGLVGLSQCRESGELGADQVRISGLWDDAFAIEIWLPAGQRVPCLGSELPRAHTIEIYGESADGEKATFPEAAVPWRLWMSWDDGRSVPIGEAWLRPVGDSYEVVWSGEEFDGPPLEGLMIALRTAEGLPAHAPLDAPPADEPPRSHEELSRDDKEPSRDDKRREEQPEDEPAPHDDRTDEGGER
jgi:hypothetical protein